MQNIFETLGICLQIAAFRLEHDVELVIPGQRRPVTVLAGNRLVVIAPHDLEGTQRVAQLFSKQREESRNVLELVHRHQRALRAAGLRKQAQHRAGNDAQRTLRADEQLFHIVAGIVLHHPVHGGHDRAVCQYCFQPQHEVAHHAVTQNVDAAGIGRNIAADGATATCAEVERETQALLGDGLLHDLQHRTGFDRGGTADSVDLEDSIHPVQRQHDIVCRRLHRGHTVGQPPVGHDRLTGCMATTQHCRHLVGIRRQHPGLCLHRFVIPEAGCTLGHSAADQHPPGTEQARQLFDDIGQCCPHTNR